MINFNSIPASLRYPGVYIEVDGSMAGLDSGAVPNLLLVGYKLATGTAASNEIVFAASLADVIDKAGAGSMLAQMAERLDATRPILNMYILPLTAPVSGVAASASLTVTDAATDTGMLSVYVGGVLAEVAVTVDMTTAQIADAIKVAITATTDVVTVSG